MSIFLLLINSFFIFVEVYEVSSHRCRVSQYIPIMLNLTDSTQTSLGEMFCRDSFVLLFIYTKAACFDIDTDSLLTR